MPIRVSGLGFRDWQVWLLQARLHDLRHLRHTVTGTSYVRVQAPFLSELQEQKVDRLKVALPLLADGGSPYTKRRQPEPKSAAVCAS